MIRFCHEEAAPRPYVTCNPAQSVWSGLVGMPCNDLADISTLQTGGYSNLSATSDCSEVVLSHTTSALDLLDSALLVGQYRKFSPVDFFEKQIVFVDVDFVVDAQLFQFLALCGDNAEDQGAVAFERRCVV